LQKFIKDLNLRILLQGRGLLSTCETKNELIILVQIILSNPGYKSVH